MNDTKLFLVLRGGKTLHKDGTTGPGSGGARTGAGRKKKDVSEPPKQLDMFPDMPVNEYKTSAPQSVIEEENTHADDPVESLSAFTPSGERLTKTEGGTEQVDPTDEERAKMRGAIITHNHPYQSTEEDGGNYSLIGLSANDVFATLQVGGVEIRSVDKHGAYLFQAKLPLKEFPTNHIMRFKANLADFQRAHTDEYNKAYYTTDSVEKLLRLRTVFEQEKIKFAVEKLGGTYAIYDRKTGKRIEGTVV